MINIPISILEKINQSSGVLIVGIGSDYDFLSALPIYFTLEQLGKNVHLANYTPTAFNQINAFSQPVILNNLIFGANATVNEHVENYAEGYLSHWFKEKTGEDVIIWMLNRVGANYLQASYQKLISHLGVDTIITVEAGTKSIMMGNEEGCGNIVDSTINLAALKRINIKNKFHASIGFSSEIEDGVCNFSVLENIALLDKMEAFYGSCSLTNKMKSFKLYEEACNYIWNMPGHIKSKVNSRVIISLDGEVGNKSMFEEFSSPDVFISPLMSQYWFFETDALIYNNELIQHVEYIDSYYETIQQLVPRINEMKSSQYRPKTNINL